MTARAVFIRLIGEMPRVTRNVCHYFDDLLIANKTHKEHVLALLALFGKVREAKLTIKAKMIERSPTRLPFPADKVGQGRLNPLTETLEKIHRATRPLTIKDTRPLLGLSGNYREYIPNNTENLHERIPSSRRRER